jgi:hypothetical protein
MKSGQNFCSVPERGSESKVIGIRRTRTKGDQI